MKNTIKLAVAAALASVSAYAQSTNYTATLPGTFTTAPSGGTALNFSGSTLTLPQWNPALFPGQALTGVSYTLTSYMYGTWSITNGDQEANFQVSLITPNFSLTGPFGGSPALSRTAPHFSGGVFDVLPTFDPFESGSGTTTLGTSTTTSPASDAANLASYSGSGTVTFTLAGSATLAISGEATGGAPTIEFSQSASKFGASTVSVTYTYAPTEVPEPSTYAAMGFVGLVAGATIWRRRQMAKKA